MSAELITADAAPSPVPSTSPIASFGSTGPESMGPGSTKPTLEPGSLLALLLEEQGRLTAVDEFARRHEHDELPTQSRYYRDLIPSTLPGRDEQFAFEVDLDACSGCKACVTACHNLNGLEEEETWRGVGLLVGGTSQLPVVQHVTTACHHCLDPACLSGCPVLAYEKDPTTGIVRHLDDQCIGCQYCILKCPYDVPKYSHAKGIVRKCDMCSSRLSAGEAPACVQSCPHKAIRITIVNRLQIAEECEANLFVPGAPEPGYTLPTTVYKTARVLPRNLLPTDYYAARPQHAHWPLILMLVLTQASVGAFAVEQWGVRLQGDGIYDDAVHRGAAFVLGMLGLVASVFHLGRPQFAYRAWIGLRTSWLSREILAFGLFAGLASAYAAVPFAASWGVQISAEFDRRLGSAVAATGVLGILCSAMIYAGTQRPFWHWAFTLPKFLLTGAILGAPTALLVAMFADVDFGSPGSAEHAAAAALSQFGPQACRIMIWATLAKLLLEASVFTRLRGPLLTPLKRTAVLLAGELGLTTFQRFFLGLVGGVLLPWLLLHKAENVAADGTLSVVLLTLLSLGIVAVGELLERYLFFTAVVAPKMPGVPAA